MKVFFAITALFLSSLAQAVDTKIGNVIAVERAIPNLYQTCIKNTSGDKTMSQVQFVCGFKFVANDELAVSTGRIFKFADESCAVLAEAANGVMLISFGAPKKASSFEVASACLEKGLAANTAARVIVYTHE